MPLRTAQDVTALSQVMRDTLDTLRRAVGDRSLESAARAHWRAVCSGQGGSHIVPWRYGRPLPDGAVMLVCVADAVIRT